MSGSCIGQRRSHCTETWSTGGTGTSVASYRAGRHFARYITWYSAWYSAWYIACTLHDSLHNTLHPARQFRIVNKLSHRTVLVTSLHGTSHGTLQSTSHHARQFRIVNKLSHRTVLVSSHQSAWYVARYIAKYFAPCKSQRIIAPGKETSHRTVQVITSHGTLCGILHRARVFAWSTGHRITLHVCRTEELYTNCTNFL